MNSRSVKSWELFGGGGDRRGTQWPLYFKTERLDITQKGAQRARCSVKNPNEYLCMWPAVHAHVHFAPAAIGASQHLLN